jgi:hypothetical protein
MVSVGQVSGLRCWVSGSGTPPARRYSFDESKHDQAEPKVDEHAKIDFEWRVPGAGGKVSLYQKVHCVAGEHSYQSVEEVSGRF